MTIFARSNAARVTRWLVVLWLVGLSLALLPSVVRAYVLDGTHWVSNQPIVMDLQLGSPPAPLLDGATSWDAVAESALYSWNMYLGSGVQFAVTRSSVAPGKRDGKNSVFFSNTVFGESFGDDTLAVTLTYRGGVIRNEADVLFNSAQRFDSYRGRLRVTATGGVLDLYRIALHEFGHVLGLEHVAQSAPSIMTPAVTNIDALQADDIAGAQAIYGPPSPTAPVITSSLMANGQPGQLFYYRTVATNFPTIFAADGLPPGLEIDPDSGLITGDPTEAGVYDVALTASNGAGTSVVTLVIAISVPPSLASGLVATGRPNEFFRYQIPAGGTPTKYLASSLPGGLTIDTTTGVISGVPPAIGPYSVPISVSNVSGVADGTLTIKIIVFDPSLTTVDRFGSATGGQYGNSLLRVNDGNVYIAVSATRAIYKVTPGGGLAVFHAFGDGEDEQNYTPTACLIQAADGNLYGATSYQWPSYDSENHGGAIFRLAPDGAIIYLHRFAGVEGRRPAGLIQADDGNFYGVTASPNLGYSSVALFKMTPDGSCSVLHAFDAPGYFQPSNLVQASDGNLYGSLTDNSGSVVFRCSLAGDFAVAHQFTIPEGALPGALTQASDGNLYGTSSNGGANQAGTIFRLTLDGALTVIHDFNFTDGCSYLSRLTQASDGNLYGTSAYGGYGVRTWGSGGPTDFLSGSGTVFATTLAGDFTLIHTFDGAETANPIGGLAQGGDGGLYGVTTWAPGGAGVLFRKEIEPLSFYQLPVAALETTTPEVAVGSGGAAVFTVTLSVPQIADTVVAYTIKGNAINGADYLELKGTAKIKAGKTSKAIKVRPLGDLGGAAKKTVKLGLMPGEGYTVGDATALKVKIVAGQ